MTKRVEPARKVSSRLRGAGLAVLVALFALLASALAAASFGGWDWRTIGAPSERLIGPENVGRLRPKWVATTTGDVSATPAVVNGAVYFGDFGGTLWKLDAETGQVVWSRQVGEYTGIAGDIARTSPSMAGDTLIVGDLRHPYMLGINARNGDLRWITQVHPDPLGIMTGSPVLVGNIIYTGVSASGASGPNATFRGSIVALDARTGRILWQSYSLPDNGGNPGGYAGATMFSPPAVDSSAGLVYGTFGQPYTEPASVTACHAANGGFAESCEQPGSYLKSIVAFDMWTGKPRWSYRVQGHDPWVRACGSQPYWVTWCAAESDSEKWDLGGSGANVMRVRMQGRWRDVVGVGGKSGVYYALDAGTGAFLWNSLIGPGGDQGGMNWGTAFDGERIYAPITNHHHIPYLVARNGVPSDKMVTGGSWAALDPATGRILWQTADPQQETLAGTGTVGVWDLAPVTAANGVVYAASMAKDPQQNQLFALDAANGRILWQYGAGGSVNAAPAVVNGSVYWGTGYSRSGVEGSGNNQFYAFTAADR
jgi:polyvinyl alcohol dehydrogenase (cytochrome)